MCGAGERLSAVSRFLAGFAITADVWIPATITPVLSTKRTQQVPQGSAQEAAPMNWKPSKETARIGPNSGTVTSMNYRKDRSKSLHKRTTNILQRSPQEVAHLANLEICWVSSTCCSPALRGRDLALGRCPSLMPNLEIWWVSSVPCSPCHRGQDLASSRCAILMPNLEICWASSILCSPCHRGQDPCIRPLPNSDSKY